MKKNDFIFLTVSLLYAIVFVVISISQTLPEKPEKELSSTSAGIKPTGTVTDIEKIQNMIQNKKLSNREALFYQKIGEEEDDKKQSQNKQQIRRRQRRGRHSF